MNKEEIWKTDEELEYRFDYDCYSISNYHSKVQEGIYERLEKRLKEKDE